MDGYSRYTTESKDLVSIAISSDQEYLYDLCVNDEDRLGTTSCRPKTILRLFLISLVKTLYI